MKLPDHAVRVYEGKIFQVHEWNQLVFDGSTETYERVSALPIVKLICVLKDGQILVNEEEQPWKDLFHSLPGGRLELGETLLEWARRELLEETWYTANEFTLLDTHHVGYRLDLDIHLFVARGCAKTSEIRLDPGERIRTYSVDIDTLLEQWLGGQLKPKSLQYLLLREHYKDPTLTQLKNTILGNLSHLAT